MSFRFHQRLMEKVSEAASDFSLSQFTGVMDSSATKITPKKILGLPFSFNVNFGDDRSVQKIHQKLERKKLLPSFLLSLFSLAIFLDTFKCWKIEHKERQKSSKLYNNRRDEISSSTSKVGKRRWRVKVPAFHRQHLQWYPNVLLD